MSEHSLQMTAGMKFRMMAIMVLGSSALIACTGAQYAEERDEVVAVPDAYSAVEVESGPRLDAWCSDFGSPELATLVNRAFDENFDLRQSWARLEQAEAIRRQSRSTLFPTVDASATVGAQRQQTLELDDSTVPPQAVTSTEVVPNYLASLGAAYEVDLWGRLAAQRSAATYDAAAARADVESMAISVTSQIADAWFETVAQREKSLLLEEQIETAQKYLELTVLRLSQGVATAIDVNQQQQQIENLRGQLARVEGQRELAENRLAVLLGEAPTNGPTVTTEELPELPELPAAGIPAELLERRPDVRSALLRLESADARTAAAARDKLPSLRLSASVFLQAQELGNLLDEVFWSIAGTLTQTVFAGGRKDAEQERAEAAAKERLYAYANAVVRAIADVENAIVQEATQDQFLEHLEAQYKNAQVALDLARQRYRSGTLDYLRVLTALQSLQQIEQSLVDARQAQLSTRVSLCRALGGSWTQELSQPADEFSGDES